MPSFGDITGRLSTNVRDRVDSVTKTMPEDFRSTSAVETLFRLGQRFGRNNRALIGR
jgi:hypothetical protein